MQKLSRSRLLVFILALLTAGGVGCSKQARKNRYLARADQDFQAERFDKAEIEYLTVQRIPPPTPLAITRLGLIYYIEGKLPQACAYLQKGLELQPDDLDARAKLARAFLALRSFKQAREEAIRVLDKQCENQDALLVLAGTTVTTNLLPETRQRLDSLPQKAKETAAYYIARSALSFLQGDLGRAEVELKQAVANEPKSCYAFTALGELYLVRGDLKQAEAAFKTAADLAPIRSPARLRYADLLVKTGATDAARETVTEITKKAPDYVPAWVFLAQLAFAQQKRDACESLINSVLARDPINLDTLVLKGNLLLARGDATNAVAQFERILNLSLYKQVPAVRCRLALAQLQSGATAKAVQTLNSTLADQPNSAEATLLLANLNIRKGETASAIVSLKRLIAQQPQLAQAHLLLATAYLVRRQPDDVVAVYRRMEELFPKSPEVPQLLGIVLAQQGNKPESRKCFEKSLQIAPTYLPALENLVDLDILDKQYTAAKERVHQQMQKDSQAAGPWLLMAKIDMAEAMGYVPEEAPTNAGPSHRKLQFVNNPVVQAEVGQAESALLKAISLDPGLSTSYLLLARLYVASGKQQLALDRLNGFVSKTNDVAALMQIGLIQDELKNYPAAKDAYEKVLFVNPKFSPALNNLAYLYSERLGQLEKAYQMAEKARQLMPYDPSTADTLGWILWKRGEYTRALGLLEESADKLPSEPEVQFHLGMTHYMLGEEEVARAQLETSVRSSKDFPGKEQAARCLKILAVDSKTAGSSVIEQLETGLRETPNDPVAFSRLGAIQERNLEFPAAAETYKQALSRNPKNPQFMLRLAQIYSRHLNRPDEALQFAKDAHALAPEDPQICYVLGQLVFQKRDHVWAASLLEEAARKLPSDPDVAYDLAWAYYSLGRVAEALSKMQVALAAGAASAIASDGKRFLMLVNAANDLDQSEVLVGEARNVLAGDPNYVPALMLCGAAEERQGHYADAASTYKRVLGRYPTFVPATKRLAQLYFEHLGDDTKAFELASKARESSSKDPDIAKVLGVLAYRRGDFGRSVQLLDEAARQRPTDAELQYYLGMALFRLKDSARSKVALQRAVDLNLRAQLVDEAKRTMRELQ